MLLINILHALLVIFIILVPFIGQKDLLEIHAIIIPFILLHWYLNDSTCMLTEIEKRMTGKDAADTFMGRLFEPVYKFQTKEGENIFLWMAMLSLWLVTMCRVGKIRGLY